MTLRTLATPLTIGSFISVCITGLCLLAGYRQGLVKPVHEVTSILFALGSVLHIAINWRPTLNHLRQPLNAGLILGFLIVSAWALLPTGNKKDDPRRVLGQATEVILDAKLQEVAMITRQPEQALKNRLAQAGFGSLEPSATLRDIASSSRRNSLELLAVVLPSDPATKTSRASIP